MTQFLAFLSYKRDNILGVLNNRTFMSRFYNLFHSTVYDNNRNRKVSHISELIPLFLLTPIIIFSFNFLFANLT